MATSENNDAGHPAMDYEEHDRTYDLFIMLTKWGIISVSILLILMAYFLV